MTYTSVANCNTYNADFDGDEMNLHFPQNEVARAEAVLIANTDAQYLVPTDGSPLRGLIQDHVVAGVWMTKRDSFFTADEYQQLLYGALRPEEDPLGSGRIITLPPAIIKPVPLWTGKQVISTILKNLTFGHPPFYLKSKARVPGRFWGSASEESTVIVHHGELVQGVLDKSQFGASAYGLVHTVYELYGPQYAGKLLSMLGRLFTKYLQSKAFTCRMDDLRLTEEGDCWRRELMESGARRGPDAVREYIGLSTMQLSPEQEAIEYKRRMEEVIRDDEKLQGLDAVMKSAMNSLTSQIIDKCIPKGLFKTFPENNMQMMTVSGAKGSNVNVSQISCCLGQQELEGRRVPIMISGKSLPSFKPFDSSARAGGYIAGRFLTGIRPQEYFFHCMAGREGLIDTAVKTSRSGYLQRCLVKHLEGLRVNYDHTVRDADGSVLQVSYDVLCIAIAYTCFF
jgi:DNA-directed RNA polymerase I subunit RPA1